MKRYASHRLYIHHDDLLLRNQVVEVNEISGEIISYYSFTEEISFTEWLGGLIVISGTCPSIVYDEEKDMYKIHLEDIKKTRSMLSTECDNTLLRAYYISDFNVSSMSLSEKSRVILLS